MDNKYAGISSRVYPVVVLCSRTYDRSYDDTIAKALRPRTIHYRTRWTYVRTTDLNDTLLILLLYQQVIKAGKILQMKRNQTPDGLISRAEKAPVHSYVMDGTEGDT